MAKNSLAAVLPSAPWTSESVPRDLRAKGQSLTPSSLAPLLTMETLGPHQFPFPLPIGAPALETVTPPSLSVVPSHLKG